MGKIWRQKKKQTNKQADKQKQKQKQKHLKYKGNLSTKLLLLQSDESILTTHLLSTDDLMSYQSALHNLL